MSESFTVQGASYTIVDCYSCGVRYLIPTILNRQALDDRGPNGQSVHCPNGHAWYYTGETDEQKLRRERDRLLQRIAEKDDTITAKDREIAAEKRRITRMQKREKAGACPCCKRTFTNMALHMKHQHPNFAVEKPALKVVATSEKARAG